MILCMWWLLLQMKHLAANGLYPYLGKNQLVVHSDFQSHRNISDCVKTVFIHKKTKLQKPDVANEPLFTAASACVLISLIQGFIF